MRVLLIVAAISLSTPVFAQTSSSEAAATGLVGLMGMLGLFGFVVAFFYSVVLFFLPFMVWKCLRRLTSIRDDVRRFRQEITTLAKQVGVTSPLPSTTGQHQVHDTTNLRCLVEENQKTT